MKFFFGRMPLWAFALLAWASNVCAAETSDEAKVRATAQRFFDDYNKQVILKNMGYEESIAWVSRNPVPTPEYVSALAKLYRDGLKIDPQYGIGADAVICGQVFPEEGCEVRRVWIEGPLAFVFLTSRNPRSTAYM